MTTIKKHHQSGPDGSGYYAADIEAGQGLTIGSRVAIVSTITPTVRWHDDSGTVTVAWSGSGYDTTDRNHARATKAARFQADVKAAELRRYYMLNDRRWEIVMGEERAALKAKREAEHQAARRLREAGPAMRDSIVAMLAEIKLLTLDPLHPLAIQAQHASDVLATLSPKSEGTPS